MSLQGNVLDCHRGTDWIVVNRVNGVMTAQGRRICPIPVRRYCQ